MSGPKGLATTDLGKILEATDEEVLACSLRLSRCPAVGDTLVANCGRSGNGNLLPKPVGYFLNADASQDEICHFEFNAHFGPVRAIRTNSVEGNGGTLSVEVPLPPGKWIVTAGMTHCWVDLNQGDKILATLLECPESDAETTSVSSSTSLPDFKKDDDSDDDDVESNAASNAPSNAASSSVAPSLAGSALDMFMTTVHEPGAKPSSRALIGVWGDEPIADVAVRDEGPGKDDSEDVKLQAEIANASFTQEVTMKAANALMAEAKAAKAKGVGKRWGPPPVGPAPKVQRPDPPPVPKQPDVSFMKGQMPPPPPRPEKRSIPPPPPKPERQVPAPKLPENAKAKTGLLKPTWANIAAKAKQVALLTPAWKSSTGSQDEPSASSTVVTERAEGLRESEIPLLSPQEEVTPSELNPFRDITSAFLEQLDDDGDATMVGSASPHSDARSKREKSGNKIKIEPEPSPVINPCTPTSDAEFVSETVSENPVPLVLPKQEEFEVAEEDDHFVRQIMIPFCDLHSSFTPTPQNLSTLRIAYEAKASYDAGLHELSISHGDRAAIFEDLKSARTTVITALWSLSSDEPVAEGYCTVTSGLDSSSRNELLRVLEKLKNDLDLCIENATPPDTALSTPLSTIPEDVVDTERAEGSREDSVSQEQHLPYNLHDPRHRNDKKLSPDESETIAEIERAKAKAAGKEGAAVWGDDEKRREAKKQKTAQAASGSTDVVAKFKAAPKDLGGSSSSSSSNAIVPIQSAAKAEAKGIVLREPGWTHWHSTDQPEYSDADLRQMLKEKFGTGIPC